MRHAMAGPVALRYLLSETDRTDESTPIYLMFKALERCVCIKFLATLSTC